MPKQIVFKMKNTEKNLRYNSYLFTIIQREKWFVFKGQIEADFLPLASVKIGKISKVPFYKTNPSDITSSPLYLITSSSTGEE